MPSDSDPFDDKEHQECQWYLEIHVLNDHFAEGRARRVVTAFGRYERNLWRQLDLSFADGSTVELIIDEGLAGDINDCFRIYRLYWELLEESQGPSFGSHKLRVRRFLTPFIASVSSHRRPLGPIPPAYVKRAVNVLYIAA